jgi:hypothetical protein
MIDHVPQARALCAEANKSAWRFAKPAFSSSLRMRHLRPRGHRHAAPRTTPSTAVVATHSCSSRGPLSTACRFHQMRQVFLSRLWHGPHGSKVKYEVHDENIIWRPQAQCFRQACVQRAGSRLIAALSFPKSSFEVITLAIPSLMTL